MTESPPPIEPPPPLAYRAPADWSRDGEHLRLLAIFHYIIGGIIALLSSCAIFYLVFGLFMIANPRMLAPPPGAPPQPAAVGYMFTIIGGVIVFSGWIIGGLIIYSGRCIAGRRSRTFSLILAGVMCLWLPFGTILGIFTFLVLLRESVAQLYGAYPPTPYSSQGM
jgi:hypothetical protein